MRPGPESDVEQRGHVKANKREYRHHALVDAAHDLEVHATLQHRSIAPASWVRTLGYGSALA
jgi:hypothetical protein